ncbi:helix-turn-helix domain-containing protein [Geomicrobium sp. JCM 19038]|uniref:helix-turn-helix domain-containing protein n=1 Tax=Geomicrobium sp. JCM 19038 TaxID=1460635 RepID=UPI00045F3C33|nr:helix-turn-helix domain-containing protein [Geomicrobium sp. JCM 19038]GAK07175.1 DNA-binding response regulator, AraC family [Geomicrobium sp. JCM 19038]
MSTQFVVADRDQNDRIGMKWVIETMDDQHFVRNFTTTYDETVVMLAQNEADIVIIELDMIATEDHEGLASAIARFQGTIIAVASMANFEAGKCAVEIGAKALLRKPVQADDLKRAVSTVTKRNSHRIQTSSQLPSLSKRERVLQQIYGKEIQSELEFSMLMFRTRNRETVSLIEYVLQLSALQPFTHTITCTEDSVFVIIDQQSTKTYNLPNECLNAWPYYDHNPLVVSYFVSTGKNTYHQGYLSCQHVNLQTYFSGEGKVLFANQLKSDQRFDFPFLTIEDHRLLLSFIQHRDEFSFIEWCKAWLYTYEEEGRSLLFTKKRTAVCIEFLYYELDSSITKDGETGVQLATKVQEIGHVDHAEQILSILTESFQMIVQLQANEKTTISVEIVKSALHYMKSQYNNPLLTLKDVADYVDRNPSYLGQLFVQHEQGTFRQVLRDFRLDAAKKKLTMTRQSVKQLAYDVGYRDPNYFSRQFKDKTGLSPRAYRDEHKEPRS